MTRVELAPELLDDFDRIFDHLAQHDVPDISARIAEIVAALDLLQHHPRIGRPCGQHRRELILGRGSRGYVALYEYMADIDTVLVLAIRSQREAGYMH